MRTTVYQARMWEDIPKALGKCAEDIPAICSALNAAIYNLILAGGETGWFGGWLPVIFQVHRRHPYVTLPREIARVIDMDVEGRPIHVHNDFYEFLPDGAGYHPDHTRHDWCGRVQGYERGTFPTMVDLDPTNQMLRAYCTDARDAGKRILIKGKDTNGLQIYSTDNLLEVNGFYLTLALPFVTSSFQVSVIDNVIKDATFGDVPLYQVDATTGVQELLSRYAPNELTPEYRRYFLSPLPHHSASGHIQVRAMAKLEFIPVSRDTDFLLIGCLPALAKEIEANRYSKVDSSTGKELGNVSHAQATKLLQNELVHYGGRQRLAVNVKPFGSAALEHQMLGQLY